MRRNAIKRVLRLPHIGAQAPFFYGNSTAAIEGKVLIENLAG
jgi:hypothetical protein